MASDIILSGAANQTGRERTIPISGQSVYLCLDMQNLIGPEGPWHADWAQRVLPNIVSLAEARPDRCIFTRFMPPPGAQSLPGAWGAYFRKWWPVTQEYVEPYLLELMTPLKLFVPPATVIDKPGYDAFRSPQLVELLQKRQAERLIIAGAETDMCVVATVLAAVERGYYVTVVEDAVCSASDPCHDAALSLFRQRFSVQIDIKRTDEVLADYAA